MRIFALRDGSDEQAHDLAYLECYEQPNTYFFEMPPDADPWELPFILHEFAARHTYTVDANWSRRWVESRLVPPERQNIGEVLRTNGLTEYDTRKLLELTLGKCAQDDCYLAPVDAADVPAWYDARVAERAYDVFALSGFRLLVSFCDDTTMVCAPAETYGEQRIFARVMSDPDTFSRVALQAGGHGVRWGERLLISPQELRAMGQEIPLSMQDLRMVSSQAVCDTFEVAEMLGCSRQNVSDLMRRKRLEVLKTNRRGTLFMRGDVLAWEYRV